jgi:signal transduction histidine kinase
MWRSRLPTFERLDRRGLLGEAPSPLALSAITFIAVMVLGLSMFALGSLDRSTPGLLLGLAAMVGLAIAVGVALAVMQYRWVQQLDLASTELVEAHRALERERDHYRTVVHDAKAAVAALGAATHALRRRDPADPVARAMEVQLAQLRATLDARTTESSPFHLEDVFDGLRSFSALHDVDLTVRPTESVVVGDATATLQILQNLVDNSRKYAKGSTVRVWSEEAGPHHTMVVVEDDGDGIEADAVEMAFTPGVRLRTGQGYGLGLSSARQLAEAQGGALWYDDSWQGARFVLKLSNAEER